MEARKWDRYDVLYAAALAFSYFVFAKIADWLLGGFLLNTFGPQRAAPVHAGIFALVVLAWVARGWVKLRDRFALVVGALTLAIPLLAYLLT